MAAGKKVRLSFVWQGITQRQNHWRDGLWRAMKYLEEKYDVEYCEPWEDLTGDIILMWEAACTANGGNADNYNRVRSQGKPKALLFAGGPLEKAWVIGFDLLFVESQISVDECKEQNIPFKRAFGINDDIFRKMDVPKIYDGIHHGTCASWKRQQLLAEALGNKALIIGQEQKSDPAPFEESKKFGARVITEVDYQTIAVLLNTAHCLVQTSDFWGGGQRATLEALACGVPVVCMSDSPKNREFVEESGCGLVADPYPQTIRTAVDELKNWSAERRDRGIAYVNSKWTARHYAEALDEGIQSIL